MTYGAFTQDFAPYHYGRRGRRLDPKVGLCVIALGVTTSVGIWALSPHMLPSAPQIASLSPAPAATAMQTTAAVAAQPQEASNQAPKRMADAASQEAEAARQQAAIREAGLLDPALTSSYAAVVFARTAPLRSLTTNPAPGTPAPTQAAAEPQIVPAQTPVSPLVADTAPQNTSPLVATTPETSAAAPSAAPLADVPLPQRRPANLGSAARAPARLASGDRDIAGQGPAPSTSGERSEPSFFDKLFARPKESGPVLAYAAPEDGAIGNVLRNAVASPQAYDRYTAVYNITTHTVTLPDGTRLEAHSGLGAARDNPRSVAQRMVGATPPNVYDLTPREALFHGVRALRMTPTGGTTYGRAGLLTHTYMLRGHSGESNGCVVFRDYEAFLRAYDIGAIRRLAVVAGG